VTATSGSLTHTAPLTIVVAAATTPDFSLSIAPQSLNVTPGGAGQAVQLSVTALNGFTGNASVALSGLPPGITASPASLTLTPGLATPVTLAAGNTAQPGSANVLFTATSGTLNHAATLALTVAASAGANVTTQHNDLARDGWNASETVLTPQNVNATAFGKLRELPTDGKVDGEPLYLSGFSIAGTMHNVLLVVTEHGSVYAFDADTGTQLWMTSSLGAGETTSDSQSCNQVSPEIGITDTPVIDRSHGPNGSVFFVAMSKDSSGRYHQRLHALDLSTGADLPGSPSEIQATFPGTGYGSTNGTQIFDPGQYVERVGLLLMNGQLYLAWTSHCDQDPYTGWVMAYSESTLQQTSVVNLTPNGPSTPHFGNGEGAIWMAGAGLAADQQGNIFLLDANGSFDSGLNTAGFPANGDFGNSFLKISTSGNVLTPADYFAAYNVQAESDADQDLGSGGAMLLPDQTDAGGVTRHLAVGAGKDTNIYVVDRDNMGKFNAINNNAVYQQVTNALPGGAWSMPALFNNTVYYAGVGDHLKAFPIVSALLATSPASQSANTFGYPGATPSVSSNGSQNGIVWAIENQSGAGVLHAYDANNLATELYNSSQAAAGRDQFSDNKFIPPMIANGKVFVGTTNSVAVFGELR
jgi:outer membrane protein assembly factor BamB